jgi:hypothetical protein
MEEKERREWSGPKSYRLARDGGLEGLFLRGGEAEWRNLCREKLAEETLVYD